MFVALLMHMSAHDVPRVVEKRCHFGDECAGDPETIDRPVTQAPYYELTVLHATRCLSRLLRKAYGEIEVKFTEKWATYSVQVYRGYTERGRYYSANIDFQRPPVNSPWDYSPPMYGMRSAHVNLDFIHDIRNSCQWSLPGGYIYLEWDRKNMSSLRIFPRTSLEFICMRKTPGSEYAEFFSTSGGLDPSKVPSEMLRIAASFGFSLTPCAASKRRKRDADD